MHDDEDAAARGQTTGDPQASRTEGEDAGTQDANPKAPDAAKPADGLPPLPAMTDAMLWATLADFCASRAERIARIAIRERRERAGAVSLLLSDQTDADILTRFATQVATNERSHCFDALKAALPDLENAIADVLIKRGPIRLTFSASYTYNAGTAQMDYALAHWTEHRP